ncbi:MAG: ATP-binding protein [Thermodesulfobacteriota bacterium]
MIPRHAEQTIAKLCRGFPVIAVTGPRQSGKTTLAQHMFSDRPYVSLENPDTLDYAIQDPRGFLDSYRDGAVFDEAQRCPALFSYLQEWVDRDRRMGRYILTGSQQFGVMSNITQSLAGRVGIVHLMPFSFKERYGEPSLQEVPNLDDVLFEGLYPPVHDRDLDARTWYANYIETYLERDVRQLVNVRDLTSFRRFVRLCAGRTGQMVNLSNLATDAGVTHNTAKSWISVLEAGFLIFLLPPHFRNFNKRLIKSPKLYFFDTGLCARLLAIQDSAQLNSHPMRGALFESYVISEYVKSRYHAGIFEQLHYWRDRSGNEIDLLVDNGDALQPIEIKSGATLNRDFFKGLHTWLKIAGGAAENPTLIYGGSQSIVRSGVQVRPWYDVPV